MKLIVDLQRGLQEALDGEDYFDVWDELDDDTNIRTVSCECLPQTHTLSNS